MEPMRSNFDITVVQKIISKAVDDLPAVMVKAITKELRNGLNLRAIAEKYTGSTAREIKELDLKTAIIYSEIFEDLQDQIALSSPALQKTLARIEYDTGDKKMPLLFMSAFLLPASKDVVEILEHEQPGALEYLGINFLKKKL